MTFDPTFCRLKLGRATEHIEAIDKDVRAWTKKPTYGFVKEPHDNGSRHSVRLKIISEPPLKQWSLIAGDCIHNLRSALDHLVYAIAVDEAGSDRPPKHRELMFPICDSRDKFDGSAPRRIKTLRAPVQAEIEQLQPYNRPHDYLPPVLAILRNFNDSDKHRLINVAIATPVKGGFTNVRNGPPIGKIFTKVYLGEVKDGVELASMTFDYPAPKLEYEFHTALQVVIRHEKGPKGQIYTEIVNLLNAVRDEVDHVIGCLEGVSTT